MIFMQDPIMQHQTFLTGRGLKLGTLPLFNPGLVTQ